MTDLTARSADWTRWLWLPAAAALLAVAGWWVTHPAELPTSGSVTTSVPEGGTTYVGVLGGDGDTERDLHLRGVEIIGDDGGTGATWQALVCRDGSVGQTTDPEQFCAEVVPAEGVTMRLADDQLILAVTAGDAGSVSVEPMQVSYRDGLQWATQPAGPSVSVEVLESTS